MDDSLLLLFLLGKFFPRIFSKVSLTFGMERYGRVVKRKRAGSYSARKRTSTYRAARAALYRAIETKYQTIGNGSWTDIGAIQGTLIQLSAIAQGTSNGNRIGNKVTVTRIVGSVTMGESQAGGFPDSTTLQVRMMIVQSRGSTLATGDMPGLDGQGDIDKYFVIMDEMCNFKSSAAYNGTNVRKYIDPMTKKVNIKVPWKRLTFDDSATSARDHPVYLYLFASNGSLEQKYHFHTFFKDG